MIPLLEQTNAEGKHASWAATVNTATVPWRLNNNRDITAAVGLQNETVCVGEKSPQASVEVFQLYSKYLQDLLKVVGTRYP